MGVSMEPISLLAASGIWEALLATSGSTSETELRRA